MHKRRARVVHFRYAADDFAVLSFPLDEPALFARLTVAEREVARLVIEGRSNAEIARARGVALRTVANQVASILAKAGVGSRAELVARAGEG